MHHVSPTTREVDCFGPVRRQIVARRIKEKNAAPDGAYPESATLIVLNGTLYGTTNYGGKNGYGIVQGS
jgi:hypothetical protein